MARDYNIVPIVTEINADIETPISVFMKICGNKENSVLLESHLGGENFGRFSFICFNPFSTFYIKGNKVMQTEKGKKLKINNVANPLDLLRLYLSEFKQARIKGLPDFTGGLIGYIGYEMVKFCDDIKIVTKEKSGYCDAIMMLARTVISFDNQKNKIQIINNMIIDDFKELKVAYEKGTKENKKIIEKLQSAKINHHFLSPVKSSDKIPESNFSKDKFIEAVKKAKEHIIAGDAFQIVLSQKFKTKIKGNAFNLYRAFRNINPSRYMFYLNFGDTKLIGSSPEIMVKLKDEEITLRPIAGTIKRTHNEEMDKKLAEELKADPKEIAEHIMLLDLGRNDVGRVSKFGTVQVTEYMEIEKFSHVMHMVSNVVGKIKEGLNAFDVFKACFPQGTLTGAPKIRAMEIINELEPSDRGPYGGAVGYFGFNGDMDTCITIRTISILDDKATIQVGAGIVADSIPEKEYNETLLKAAGSFAIL
ncbi:anthranilate synthase component I [Patescibacteria group bacterium]|nr:anthranilate synthase component I [Patescibacteria group bacterium]